MRFWISLLLLFAIVSPVFAISPYGTIEPIGTCFDRLDTSNAKALHPTGTSSRWTTSYNVSLSDNEQASFSALMGKQIWDEVLYYQHADVPEDMRYNIVYAWSGVRYGDLKLVMEVWNFWAVADRYFVFILKPDRHGMDCGFYTISKDDFWTTMLGYGCTRKRC